jgi:15-cis-phytoene synthase
MRARPPRQFDLVQCEALMRGGSKSFFAASRVLPRRVRAPAVALYAFCRVADDEVDLQPHDHDAVPRLLARLDRIYANQPDEHVVDQAMACVVHGWGIPKLLPAALIEGFAWDAQGRRYETIDDLQAYGARVAGTVGAMMSLIMDTRSASALARACELGCAMQLTNIARDVGEDARNGRLYLPRQWLREAGVDPDAWLAAPHFDAAIAQCVARLLGTADALYRRAEQGVAELPRDCRPAIQAARLVYAEIGSEVERHHLDSVTSRAVVSSSRKAWLMARALGAAVHTPAAPDAALPALPQVQFLVDAAAQADPALDAQPNPHRVPERSFQGRMIWMADLFERLHHQDEARQA